MAVKTTMQAINEVVGDTEGDTQATQVYQHARLLHNGRNPSIRFGCTQHPRADILFCSATRLWAVHS